MILTKSEEDARLESTLLLSGCVTSLDEKEGISHSVKCKASNS